MSEEHVRHKILAHDAIPPFPKVFWCTFAASLLYLLVVFLSTGSHFLVGGHH